MGPCQQMGWKEKKKEKKNEWRYSELLCIISQIKSYCKGVYRKSLYLWLNFIVNLLKKVKSIKTKILLQQTQKQYFQTFLSITHNKKYVYVELQYIHTYLEQKSPETLLVLTSNIFYLHSDIFCSILLFIINDGCNLWNDQH